MLKSIITKFEDAIPMVEGGCPIKDFLRKEELWEVALHYKQKMNFYRQVNKKNG